jgi:pimeloyl-ACP methyl ester carboxylesterase
VALYRAGDDLDAEPVLLVHSGNAAASSYEMRPLFVALSAARPTFAIDLPGFGRSSRQAMPYRPEMMVTAIRAALDETGPAHVVALSLGCEFAAAAALAQPDAALSLSMISPTGLSSRSSTSGTPWLERFVSAPVVGQTSFDLLTTRASIRWFLDKSFHGSPDEGLVAYAHASAHQPNARFAPAAFVSGALFTPDAATRLYANVQSPLLVLYDTDPYSTFTRLPELLERGTDVAAVRVPDTAGLPHFEQLGEVLDALDGHFVAVEGVD